jgi:hypothetical protein
MKQFSSRRFIPVVLTLLVAANLAACGGDDGDGGSSSAASSGTPASGGTGTGGGATGGTGTGAGTGVTHSVVLSWTPPQEYEDGTPFFDLAGYRLRFGVSPGAYTRVLDIRPDVTSFTLSSLKATTYYFAMTAYNNSGAESALSNEIAIRLP